MKNPMKMARDIMRDGRINRNIARDSKRIPRGMQRGRLGWMIPYLSAMGNSGNWAYSCNSSNKIVIGNNYPLTGNWASPGALFNAAAVAVQGAAGKTTSAAQWPIAPAAVSLNLSANTSSAFGVFVRISDSVTNFKFSTYEVELFNGIALQSYIQIVVTTLPAEFFILSINNNVGNATIVPNTDPIVTFPYSAVAGAIGNTNAGAMNPGNALYAETINMRDIQMAMQAIENGAILI